MNKINTTYILNTWVKTSAKPGFIIMVTSTIQEGWEMRQRKEFQGSCSNLSTDETLNFTSFHYLGIVWHFFLYRTWLYKRALSHEITQLLLHPKIANRSHQIWSWRFFKASATDWIVENGFAYYFNLSTFFYYLEMDLNNHSLQGSGPFFFFSLNKKLLFWHTELHVECN